MTIADVLAANFVKVHDTSTQSNDLLDQLFTSVPAYLQSNAFAQQQNVNSGWFSAITRLSQGSIRLGNWCLNSVLSKRPRTLIPSDHDPRFDEGAGQYSLRLGVAEPLSKRPIVLFMPAATKSDVEAYLASILKRELAKATSTALDAAGSDHRAIVSLDYYTNRPLTQYGAHKDTAGNTLFVALHYPNTKAMAGPEYIIDRWPIPAETGKQTTGSPRPERRKSAPWSTHQGCSYWPHALLQELEKARAKLMCKHNELIFESSQLGPYGLISFVDELIYHLTPLREPRSHGGSYDYYNMVEVAPQQKFELISGLPNLIRSADIVKSPGNWFGWGPEWVEAPSAKGRKKLTRRMSIDLRDSAAPSGTGGLTTRRFVRLWISVVPTKWYREVTQVA